MKIHNLFDKVFRHKISQQNPLSEVFGHICCSRAFTYPTINVAAIAPVSYTSNVCQESFTIGQEASAYMGGAFDGVLNDANATGSWYAVDGGYVNAGWTGQDFGSGNSKNIGKYAVYMDNPTYAPKTWTFEASVTGAWTGEQVVLDTQTNYAFDAVAAWHEFEFTNSNSYRCYRFNVSANNGNASYLVAREIEMYEIN